MPTMTAAQQRAAAKVEYDAYLATCPSRQLLDTLSDKWVVLVMSALAEGPHRYSALTRRIAGVSQKMLTQTLRGLERDGLVTRTVRGTVPVTVTYDLTELGQSLFAVVSQLKAWAEANIAEVIAARSGYGERSAAEDLP